MSRVLSSSFRDPSGFLFTRSGSLYRQVNVGYSDNYELLISSGLYSALVDSGALIAHEEVDAEPLELGASYRVLKPARVDFISYPYEWAFSQLQDAALLTLSIQQTALQYGMSLKDASAYNIQWTAHGRPVLIDTLSFERYEEDRPWVAYRQFCQHFVAPLALMAGRDVRLGRLLSSFIDGVPVDLCSHLLPRRSWASFGLLTHIHLHAKAQRKHADSATTRLSRRPRLSRNALIALLVHLEATIKKLSWAPEGTEWGDYYDATNYTDTARDSKHRFVEECLERASPRTVWDLGGNTGLYSRIASRRGVQTVCFDIDPAAVEKNYQNVRRSREPNLLPLVLDLTNPSPAIGWAHEERSSFAERGPCDMVFALALIHHLAISNNVPLPRIAAFLTRICTWALVEFVPKSDSQVKRLLSSREDVFPDYIEAGFRRAMGRHFSIEAELAVAGSERTLFLLKRRT